jgi:prepilin-type processing-associated H-X9-DG protein
MNLLLSPETIRRRERELVLAAPLMLQLGVHLDGSSMSLDGAHGNAFGSDITLLCPAGDDPGPVAPGAETATPCAGNSGVFSPAVEGDVIYAWRFFEVGVVGFGYRMIPLSRDGRTHVDRSDTRFVDIERGRAFTLRFPSVGVRWLFGPSIEPFFRTGPTLEFERFRGVESGNTISPDEVTLRRNSVFWEARAGVRVHANRLIYGWVDGHVAGNLSHNDGTRGGATLGVGINLPDLFGFDDMLNERFPRRGPRSERDTSTTPQPGDSLPEQL